MPKVAIVTDSTAYIPEKLVKEYSISIAPQVVIWGEEIYEDGVDIFPDEFYSRLANTDIMPTTSQVSPKSFEKIFTNLLAQEFEILAILVSEFLSGTIGSANQVKESLPEAPIEIFDSQTVAMSLGFQALQAARAAASGASLAECKQIAEQARNHVGVVFAVDTLEFLHRGGRIGGASRFLGAALNLKPILEVKEGKIEAIERVRTRRKSLNRLIELVEERLSGVEPVRIASLHANAPEDAQYLLEISVAKFNPVETIFSEVSPAVGTHAGPGTVGLAYCAGI